MRPYKFRGRRLDNTPLNGQWVYGHYVVTPLTDENSGTTPDAGWFFLCGEQRHCIVQNGVAFVVDPETVGQYTGLTDRNEKEIYEVDILSRKSLNNEQTYYYKVIWDEVNARFMSVSIGGTLRELLPASFERGYTLCGNVYEHPHLIES